MRIGESVAIAIRDRPAISVGFTNWTPSASSIGGEMSGDSGRFALFTSGQAMVRSHPDVEELSWNVIVSQVGRWSRMMQETGLGSYASPDSERGNRPLHGQRALAVCHAINASNEQLLTALSASARIPSGAFPLPAELRARLADLSEGQRRVAAQCGILLADAGFTDVGRWRAIANMSDPQSLPNDAREWQSCEDSVVLAHSVLMVAWHLVHTTPEVAGILLGMTAPVMEEYQSLGVGDLALIAMRRPHWIRPRWHDRSDVWRDLLGPDPDPGGCTTSRTLRCLSVSAVYSAHVQASLEARQHS